MPDSSFAPSSFFFTDPAVITQAAEQAFGPVSADGFRLTSKFSVAGNAMAYAVCTGVVFLQPQTGDSSKVNLVLRPYKQPVAGLNIQYFIYRGLNKADFFNGNDVIPATSTTSDLINSINAAFAAYYASSGASVPEFLATFIGFDPINQAVTRPISDFFFKQSSVTTGGGSTPDTEEMAFELPMIAGGSSLGNFVAGECGIDVVLGYGDYSLPLPNNEFVFDLSYARATEATIDISGETDDLKKKLIREQIFQFLDAAAYYGFHYRDNGVVMLNNAGTRASKTGEAIYTDVIGNFNTKNKIYLYIQSDRTRSYNFYGNYLIDETTTNSLKIGDDEDSLTAIDYSTNGWPLLVNDAPQNHDDVRNNIYLQLVTDNNQNAMLYGYTAQIDNDQQNNFCNSDYLSLQDDDDSDEDDENIFTRIINISNPAVGNTGEKLNVASFNILFYYGKIYTYQAGQAVDEQGQTITILDQPDFFDDVFDLINANPLYENDTNPDYSVITSLKFKLINHYFDKTQYGISFVQTAIVNDVLNTGVEDIPKLDRVIYVTDTVDVLNTVTSVTAAITNDTSSSASALGSVSADSTYNLPEPFYYSLVAFTDNNQNINGLEIRSKDDTTPNKILLGITQEENNQLRNLITTALINPRLSLINLFEDGNELTSPENIVYQKYKVAIVAENNGQLELLMPTTDILVYSLDRNYHFSQAYSQYMPDLAYDTDYFTVNTVI